MLLDAEGEGTVGRFNGLDDAITGAGRHAEAGRDLGTAGGWKVLGRGMDKRLILILGGARAGKSTFAEKLAQQHGGRVVYLATARVTDEEMRQRVEAHRRARPAAWRTVEAPETAPAALRMAASQADVILLDCLTNLVANRMITWAQEHYEDPPLAELQAKEAEVAAAVEELLAAYREGTASLIVVSNEVGLGVVPPYALGRAFRDALGRANAAVAAAADEVYWLVAGIAAKLKGPTGS